MSIKEDTPEHDWEKEIICRDLSLSTITLPLDMDFQPKQDITTYELAQCIEHFFRPTMPYDINDIDVPNSYLRHFNITNPNNK